MDISTPDISRNPEAWTRFFADTLDRTVAGTLGISLASISEDEIVLRMPVTDAVRQPMGLLHGGVSMVLAETAASMHSLWGLDLLRQHAVGIEINGSHLRSARDGHVIARGRPVRRARTLVVHEVEIVHEETGQLLCVSRVTNLIRDN